MFQTSTGASDHQEDLARPTYQNASENFMHMIDGSGRHEQRIHTGTSAIPRSSFDGSDQGSTVKTLSTETDEAPLADEAHERSEHDRLAYANITSKPSSSFSRAYGEAHKKVDPSIAAENLAKQVRQIFGLNRQEVLVAHHPGWLLKSVMLQGHLFLTKTNLCFYAYIPSKEDTTIKSGFLYKKSRTSSRHHRHWFILKNNILSYYDSTADLYYPKGNIDLRTAALATADLKGSVTGGFAFKLVAEERDYYFRADTASAASDWIKVLQKVIFRLNNTGDCVKINLPFRSMLDAEESDVVDFAKTLKIKIADDKDTFTINEYYFTIFESAEKILDLVRNAIKEVHHLPEPNVSGLENNNTVMDTSKSAPAYHKPEIFETLSSVADKPNVEEFAAQLVEKEKPHSIIPDLRIFKKSHDTDNTLDDRLRHTSLEEFQDQAADRQNDSPEPRSRALPKAIGQKLKNVGHIASSALHVPTQLFSTHKESSNDDPGAENLVHADTFRKQFGLPTEERLLRMYKPYFRSGVIPMSGELYVSDAHICFRSSSPGTKTRILLPLHDVETAKQETGFMFGLSGLALVLRAHEDMFFEFHSSTDRNQAIQFINGALENLEAMRERSDRGKSLAQEQRVLSQQEHEALEAALSAAGVSGEAMVPPQENVVDAPAIIFDSPNASMVAFRPARPLRFTCLTIGSRGDVQPYIALCKGLIADGQQAKIATHEEFREFVESHGIAFEPIDGNPAELMAICVEHGMFTYGFLKEASQKFRGWIDELLKSSWKACQDSDVLIESPSAMGGLHIAEALAIPYYRAFTMPWSKTRVYPQAFAVPEHNMGGNYNAFTYSAFDTLFWKAISGQVNRWRKKTLNLPATTFDKMAQHKVPFLYNFSPAVVPPAMDWHEWIRVTGYWFLDGSDDTEKEKWEAPTEVVNFIKKARQDQKKIVYIGFGSIVVSDPDALTNAVVDAVTRSGVRCILVKGWSGRSGKKESSEESSTEDTKDREKESDDKGSSSNQYGDDILSLDSIPHDWLFPQIDAACHHGGAGSLGASLRSGIPTIVKPFFGDQYFFGDRVQTLGVGVCLRKLTVSGLQDAILTCTQDKLTIQKAAKIGEQIRSERGVDSAIENIYRDLEYARSLIKKTDRHGLHDSSDESWTEVDVDEEASDDDDNDLFESRIDEHGHKYSFLRPLQNLRLPNPLGERSGSYGLSGIRMFKQKAEQAAFELRNRKGSITERHDTTLTK